MARLTTALNRALRSLAIEAEDGAVVELAKHYAAAIDADPSALKGLGPNLLDALAEMGMTPKARKAVVKGPAKPDGDSDKISELRSRREHRAAHLVAASS